MRSEAAVLGSAAQWLTRLAEQVEPPEDRQFAQRLAAGAVELAGVTRAPSELELRAFAVLSRAIAADETRIRAAMVEITQLAGQAATPGERHVVLALNSPLMRALERNGRRS